LISGDIAVKFTVSLAVALALVAGPSLAGGPTIVETDPVPVVAAAPAAGTDWSGFYGGLGYGTTGGSIDFNSPFYDLTSGNATSLFAGYLVQRGSIVYGGELAISQASDTYVDLTPAYTDEEVDQIIDLKAKVGYATNRVLFYGVLGYSQVEWTTPGAPSVGDFETSGFAYGLGADFAATERVSVGVEYLSRGTSGDSYIAGETADIDLDTLSLRVGLNF
jgi:outer membrane immunogenic protein